jgi:Ca2+/Na+ antiporter
VDDEIIPRELLNKIFIFLIVVLIQLMLFIHFVNNGIILVLSVSIFMLIFLYKNKQLKNQSENNLLKKDDSWFISKYNLSKEIP